MVGIEKVHNLALSLGTEFISLSVPLMEMEEMLGHWLISTLEFVFIILLASINLFGVYVLRMAVSLYISLILKV